MKYYYTVDNDDYIYDYQVPKYKYQMQYDLTDDWDLETLAEDCAEDWFSNHDGWERRSWSEGTPVRFNLCNDKGEVIASYDIECEYEPRFNAYKV